MGTLGVNNLNNVATVRTGGTGDGMVSWAYRAYDESWSYVWGSMTPGAVDNSGLICSYAGGPHSTEEMIASAEKTGAISSLPELPGIGLYMHGYVGVYIGNGMCIHAKNEASGVVMEHVDRVPWTQWFYIPGIRYNN